MPGNEDDGKVRAYGWNNSQWEPKGDIIERDLVAMATPWYAGNSGAGQVKVFTYGFTEMSEKPSAPVFALYPNPATDYVVIELNREY
jgi:hypothetical protein